VLISISELPLFNPHLLQTGRIGADAQAEHVIASIVAVMLSITAPLVTPFSRRFSQSVRMNAVTLLNIATVVAVAVFALRSPFDDTHQRRVFLLGSDNVRLSCGFSLGAQADASNR
jgi:hypothetical protein